MAEEYCSTPARALALVSPPPGKAKLAFWAEPTGADGRVNDNQAALLARLPGPAGGDLAALRRLEKRGLVTISERVARRAPRTNPAPDTLVSLSGAQEEALAAIEAAPGQAHLLHGVTGSGKTEVYLRAAAAALERGEGVIALVPEIALTPQTVARFSARFGDTVALLHSALSEGERYDEWRRLRSGEARIAVGPRSAVFAPVARLGLIVVDEEHDGSYKHEGDPRYDARHVAAYRAYQTRRPAARRLGDATPRDRAPAATAAAPDPRRRRPRPAAGARARHARRPPRAAPRDAPRPRRGAQVDRAAQPARLVELPDLQVLREGVGVPELRRRARPAPRRARLGLPPLRAPRARSRRAATSAARCRSPATAPAPSASRPSCATRSTSRCSGWTPTPRPTRTPCRHCSRASRPRPRGSCSAPRWSPRATTSRT